MAAGGGIAAVHNALDMRGNYAWWDNMVGSLMPGHARHRHRPRPARRRPRRGPRHPSTSTTSPRAAGPRSDEWYNFSNNVRGTAHVLATMDETTYGPAATPWATTTRSPGASPTRAAASGAPRMGHFPLALRRAEASCSTSSAA